MGSSLPVCTQLIGLIIPTNDMSGFFSYKHPPTSLRSHAKMAHSAGVMGVPPKVETQLTSLKKKSKKPNYMSRERL
jgi:hypothetical protein